MPKRRQDGQVLPTKPVGVNLDSGGFLHSVFKNQLTPYSRYSGQEYTQSFAARRLPTVLEEREAALELVKTYDKAFSCAWIDNRTVAFGTKDEKVTFLDADTLRPRHTVQLPVSPPDDESYDIPVTCGIRSLERNAHGDLLAAGGCGTKDCAILDAHSGRLITRLQAHKDWVFSVAWITDRLLATGSRDQSVKLWAVDAEPDSPVVCSTPLKSTRHEDLKLGRVREVKWCAERQELATLNTNKSTVVLWDLSLTMKRLVRLPPADELVCMATDGQSLYAAGSAEHVHIIDARARRVADNVRNLTVIGGNRSVQFRHDLMSVGNGQGELWFYDLRAGRYLPEEATAGCRSELDLGPGWLAHNDVYLEYFSGQDLPNAAYAHKWDPSGSRLFVCGGPLATGLRGCYVGLWR